MQVETSCSIKHSDSPSLVTTLSQISGTSIYKKCYYILISGAKAIQTLSCLSAALCPHEDKDQEALVHLFYTQNCLVFDSSHSH